MNRKRIYLFFLTLTIVACSGSPDKKPENLPLPQETPLTDEQLLELTQKHTFRYFWDLAETNSGLTRERYHEDEPALDEFLTTTGGTGFGLMAILVGIERGFISREDGVKRLQKIIDFLDSVPRFHGVWSHWINGNNGAVHPFSEFDNGGDLVETSFLIQGMLCVRQYLKDGNMDEQTLSTQIDRMWKEVDWNFYRGAEKQNILIWHWSPNFGWKIDFKIRGYNETLITYVLAASSPTFPTPPEVYYEGWADNGEIKSTDPDAPLPLFHQGDESKGGPLFWAHYSFLGLNPNGLEDDYANYWDHNVSHTMLNYQHCVDNPNNFRGYGPNCWGLTASYSLDFYAAHSPKNDIGVITPTAALSSFPYTPKESMAALRYFYGNLKKNIWGFYGFYDAFSIHDNWYPKRYLAIDQGPIIVMIENFRSGLLWDLFMSSPEIKTGLKSLGFKDID